MSRAPRLRPQDLDERQAALYTEIVEGARGRDPLSLPPVDDQGRLTGPFNAMLFAPDVGDAVQRLGAALRYHGTLPPRAREIVILAVASHWYSGFEQRAHERIGADVGLSPKEIAALREGDELCLADPVESVSLATARSLLRDGDLDDAQYAEGAATLGADGLYELTTLVGYYALLALQLRVYAVR